jgi:hypothetical protein
VWTVSFKQDKKTGRSTFFGTTNLGELVERLAKHIPAGAEFVSLFRTDYEVGVVEWDEDK